MKKIFSVLLMIAALAVTGGCATKTGSAAAGALGGAAGGAGAYEYRMNQELNRLEEDLQAGRIDQREYEIRKDEILRMMVTK